MDNGSRIGRMSSREREPAGVNDERREEYAVDMEEVRMEGSDY